MEATRNLCAQIPVSLHAKVREEQEKSGMKLCDYITEVLTQYYEGGSKAMSGTRTLAFQIPEELFQRLKDHLANKSERTGKKVSQKEFILDLIRQALDGSKQN